MFRFWKKHLLKRARETKNVKNQMNLARNTDYEIRIELFKNPNLHTLVLEMLVHDTDERVRYKIAKHLEDSDLIDEMISHEENSEILLRLAKNKSLSEIQQVALLSKTSDEKVWGYFAMETNSYKVMKICLSSKIEVVQCCLAKNKDLEKSIAMELAKSLSEDVRFYLACETTYEDVLDYLADNEKVIENLIEVAKNSATHNRTLYKLSRHSSDFVKEAVASNENLSKRIRKRLLSDPSQMVRNSCMGKFQYWY